MADAGLAIVAPPPSKQTPVVVAANALDAGASVVVYQPRAQAFAPVKWSLKSVENPPEGCEVDDAGTPIGDAHVCGEIFQREARFFVVGHFTSGPYSGAELLDEEDVHTEEGPGKFDHSEQCLRRFVRKDKTLVKLQRISDPDWSESAKALEPVLKQGFTVLVDSELELPELSSPERLTGPKPLQWLSLVRGYEDPAPDYDPSHSRFDRATASLAFTDPVLGKVLLNNPESLDFTIERADGTVLHYTEEFDDAPAVWVDGGIDARQQYCFRNDVDSDFHVPLLVPGPSVASDVDPSELKPVGKLYTDSTPLLGYRDSDHHALKSLYSTYEESFGYHHRKNQEIDTYEEFIAAQPIYFVRDGFGRLIRFVRRSYMALDLSEPIIYLYPPVKERVTVRIGAPVRITASRPPYRDGFVVDATPQGDLWPVGDKHSRRTLFWEGLSTPMTPSKRGFVVKQSELTSFFRTTLPKLGLRGREIDDFVTAWTRRLDRAPWYQISFVPRATLDELAPLEVTPRPDTVIRVLMDALPLQQPVKLDSQLLETPPARRGFTLVEWGGIQR